MCEIENVKSVDLNLCNKSIFMEKLIEPLETLTQQLKDGTCSYGEYCVALECVSKLKQLAAREPMDETVWDTICLAWWIREILKETPDQISSTPSG